jgi:hypothetical protein
MPKHTVTVYRPVLERVTLEVDASSKYDAQEQALEKAATLHESAWSPMDRRLNWYCPDSFDLEPFIMDEEPHLFDSEDDE